ncbi:MAG: aminotransferase class I/II-fold pyridoxal phosphate-dependent enzyme [Anaerolineae bacterium]|nr:aminotransferase class I/II-fold pyridoxal phosphate-dependent enzyme [Anaerolineae bacterium]
MNLQPADRIGSIKPYFFASLGKKIVDMRSKGIDVIRLDMGSPDLPPADFIIDAMVSAARQANRHGYTLGSGTHRFRQAVSDHYKRRFGVALDPKSEAIDLIGSKEGLFIISQVLLNPGDVSLVPDPGYGVYASGARVAGADVHFAPLLEQNRFLPDLASIPEEILDRAKLLWMNYPNNPTGGTATLDDFARLLEFARSHDIFVAHDAPYTDVGFDGYKAPSLMQVPGAKEAAIEFNSLSKAYNMAGWRLGMAVGNAQVLKYIEDYKSQQDSAIFAPILAAGEAALSGDQAWIEERNAIYQDRRDATIKALAKTGLQADIPPAALYIWARVPEGTGSMDFCAQMLDEIGVSTTPGVVFGEHGEGFLRISLVSPVENIKKGMERIIDWMGAK